MDIRGNILLAVIISHGMLFGFVMVSSAPSNDGRDGIYPQSLIQLGELNGTNYFMEVNETLSRPEAVAYCDSFGLSLVSINTKEMAEFLNRTMRDVGREGGFSVVGYYWTSGKESQEASMFVWNNTLAQVDRDVVSYWGWTYYTEYYCVTFYLYADGDTGFSVRNCYNDRYRMLCQS